MQEQRGDPHPDRLPIPISIRPVIATDDKGGWPPYVVRDGQGRIRVYDEETGWHGWAWLDTEWEE